jgi:hypothetical protein
MWCAALGVSRTSTSWRSRHTLDGSWAPVFALTAWPTGPTAPSSALALTRAACACGTALRWAGVPPASAVDLNRAHRVGAWLAIRTCGGAQSPDTLHSIGWIDDCVYVRVCACVCARAWACVRVSTLSSLPPQCVYLPMAAVGRRSLSEMVWTVRVGVYDVSSVARL